MVALYTYAPVQSQTLAFNYEAERDSQEVLGPNSSAPQVLYKGEYLSLETKTISRVLFSNLVYPRVAAKAGINADCRVAFVVYKDASVGKISTSGESCEYFSEAIEESIESFQWMPALEKGNAVDFGVKTQIEFRLK